MHNHYTEYLRGPENESWQQALERFSFFCLNLHEYTEEGETYQVLFDEYFRNGLLFEWTDAISESELQKTETRLGFSIPNALKELFQKRFVIYDTTVDGGRFGDRRVLEVYGPSEVAQYSCIHSFCTALAWNFGPYFREMNLSDEQAALLDSNFFCFGQWSNDDHERTYLLVDRHGMFGAYVFETGDDPANMQRLKPLLDHPALTMSLDALMVSHIDRSITYLLERNEIPSSLLT